MKMAIFQRIIILFVLSCGVFKVDAAAVPITDDLEITTNDTDVPNTENHVTVNESKVVIDFYPPSSSNHELHSAISTEHKAANQTPILQVFINQPDMESTHKVESTTTEEPTQTTTKPPKVDVEPSKIENAQQLLIPPASVNANIAQLPNPTEKHKQGQIIIR